jgi:hypothetical protein
MGLIRSIFLTHPIHPLLGWACMFRVLVMIFSSVSGSTCLTFWTMLGWRIVSFVALMSMCIRSSPLMVRLLGHVWMEVLVLVCSKLTPNLTL